MSRVAQRQYLFHPVTVILVSIAAASIFALLVTVLFDGEFRWFLLYYFTPIGIPFVAFLFDRAEQNELAPVASRAIDLAVLIPALTRAFVRLPFVSGHALQVAYLKLFVTHDTALFGGVIVGCLAALVYRQLKVKTNTQIERSL
jgi:hypothetical protein